MAQLSFFDNIKNGICNICFNLLSLNRQIIILFNDINHYVTTKQKILCRTCEHKKNILHNFSVREHIFLSFQ